MKFRTIIVPKYHIVVYHISTVCNIYIFCNSKLKPHYISVIIVTKQFFTEIECPLLNKI